MCLLCLLSLLGCRLKDAMCTLEIRARIVYSVSCAGVFSFTQAVVHEFEQNIGISTLVSSDIAVGSGRSAILMRWMASVRR